MNEFSYYDYNYFVHVKNNGEGDIFNWKFFNINFFCIISYQFFLYQFFFTREVKGDILVYIGNIHGKRRNLRSKPDGQPDDHSEESSQQPK